MLGYYTLYWENVLSFLRANFNPNHVTLVNVFPEMTRPIIHDISIYIASYVFTRPRDSFSGLLHS